MNEAMRRRVEEDVKARRFSGFRHWVGFMDDDPSISMWPEADDAIEVEFRVVEEEDAPGGYRQLPERSGQ